ncbi:hypothetical protein [Thermoleptolyngbya sp. M55_K2018_002]|uniref:hypothetical protein n=1 Tax=Thermoleptolyngbya sp. M55_K2018_002 TaxID=2747808 RepID=UPI001A0DCAE1|nr:hypothetical protein [Thermoleptolyngbya sp. M55_K2018_002]HIK40237.1 hypothetical protein [Thermoleptolyngbya sp. M55_K2018_002]
MPTRILLQTTLLSGGDDWTIDRFSMLEGYLRSLTDENGKPLCEVTARDRQLDANGDDPVLSQLSRADFDQLWLLALDTGDGLSPKDQAGILRFHQQGGGIFSTRDHQDMGLSMVAIPPLGRFHYFHTQNLDPDESRCCEDDCETKTISFPNYHSGSNGDYQQITPLEPLHDLLRRPDGSAIALFPAHPHEGGVGVPDGTSHARVIATGVSKITGREFNLVVAAEGVEQDGQRTGASKTGRIVAQSTFHHLADYNWDVGTGCPSFVAEPPGTGMKDNPQAIADIHCYVSNLARWLGS